MENILDLLYETIAVVLFCIGISLVVFIFYTLEKVEREVRNSLYQQHVISTVAME